MDGRIERGNQTRRLVLQRSVEIASLEGLEHLSLGRLSSELRLSKSGVFALFGSKEELQLATVRAATKIYIEDLLKPNRKIPSGVVRLWLLCQSWLLHSKSRVFPGGCFFFASAVEFSSRPGKVRDLIAGIQSEWIGHVETLVGEAIDVKEITPGTDPAVLAFTLIALLDTANCVALLHDDLSAYSKASTAILTRLHSVATDPSVLPALG